MIKSLRTSQCFTEMVHALEKRGVDPNAIEVTTDRDRIGPNRSYIIAKKTEGAPVSSSAEWSLAGPSELYGVGVKQGDCFASLYHTGRDLLDLTDFVGSMDGDNPQRSYWVRADFAMAYAGLYGHSPQAAYLAWCEASRESPPDNDYAAANAATAFALRFRGLTQGPLQEFIQLANIPFETFTDPQLQSTMLTPFPRALAPGKPEKLLSFGQKYGRWPIDLWEYETLEVRRVRLPRFGLDLPLGVPHRVGPSGVLCVAKDESTPGSDAYCLSVRGLDPQRMADYVTYTIPLSLQRDPEGHFVDRVEAVPNPGQIGPQAMLNRMAGLARCPGAALVAGNSPGVLEAINAWETHSGTTLSVDEALSLGQELSKVVKLSSEKPLSVAYSPTRNILTIRGRGATAPILMGLPLNVTGRQLLSFLFAHGAPPTPAQAVTMNQLNSRAEAPRGSR